MSRAKLLFCRMSFWFAISADFLLSNEPLTPKRILDLGFAIVGVALAFVERTDEGVASLVEYLMALVAAFGWAGRAPSSCATRIGEQPLKPCYLRSF